MHGRVLDTICTACERRAHHSANEPLCPALAAAGALPTDPTSPSGGDTDEVRDIPLAQLPRCAACGGLLRPGVVWFGEQPLHMDEIDEAVAAADLCLVVGTSSTVRSFPETGVRSAPLSLGAQVYPAAGYAYEVADHGGKVAVFNLERTEGDDEADFLFLGPCEQTLPEALFGSTGVKSTLTSPLTVYECGLRYGVCEHSQERINENNKLSFESRDKLYAAQRLYS